MEQDYNLKKWSKGCPNTGVNCRRSSCGIEYVFIPAALGDDQEGSPVAPKNGSYNNAIVYYEATGNVYLYSSDGVPTRVEKNLDSIIAELQRELNDVEEALSEETSAREAADAAIEQEIEDLRNEPDVVDIVGTYADLQAYNTSDLGDKDIIRVLVDETHDDESTYYRWNKAPQTWIYIGAIDGYYTKDQTDALLDEKQDTLTAGANVQINNNVISATDTTYTAGTGLNLNGTEFSVDLTTIAEKSDIPTTAAEVHALPDTTKYGATLTLAIDSSTYVVTATLKDQDGNTLGTAQTIDLPLESVVVSGSYDSQTKEVVLTLQSGSTIRFSVADLVSGLQETLIAGANIQIAADGKTISATDTTYSDFTGTDGAAAGTSGLVPAPATTDAGKFLKADGTWGTVQAGGGATIFYKNSGLFGWGEDIEGPLFYKDSSYQTPATSSEMYAACMAGTTYICSNQSDDLFYTEIVAASNYSTNYNFSLANIEHVLGYDCTISSYISSGTEYYSFHYNEPVSINVVQTTGSSTTNVMSQNAVTTALSGKQGTLTAGANITIDANNVISAAGGGETMLVTLTQTTIGQYSDVWVWSSDYTFAQLTANPDAIRVFVNDWCYASEGNIKPTDTKVRTSEQSTEIYLVRDLAGVEMSFILRQPRELEGQTVNPAIFNVTNFVDKDKTALLILPTLTLADNATYIPDGTTITLQTLSSDKEMYSVNGSSDCYPHERIINGNFMILPVKRKVGSGASSWVEEECLVMSASRRGTSNVADSYIYKTFMFNGEYYKMTLTSDSYPNVVYTITKIPGGQTYTAGTGISITNGVISCTFANGNGVSY